MVKLVSRGGVSKGLEKKPNIAGSEWLWSAFHELSTCRTLGMGIGPIPWTAKAEYARYYRLTEDEEEVFMFCMNYIDNIFVEEANSRAS